MSNNNLKTYPQLEEIYKELTKLANGDEEMLAVSTLYIHSNIKKLEIIIKEQEKLDDQYSDLVTGHLDDLKEVKWDLEHIKFKFNLLILKEILEEFAKVVYFDGGE